MELLQIVGKMDVFDAERDKVPFFKVMRKYMRMVMNGDDVLYPRH